MIGCQVGGRASYDDNATRRHTERMCEGARLFERCSRKTPDEIGMRGKIRPGRGLFQIKFYASVRRYLEEVLVRLPACGEKWARCSGQRVGEVSAGIAGAKNDDRMNHDGSNY